MKRTPLSRLAWIAAAAVLFPAITLAGTTPTTTAAPATAQKAHAARTIAPSKHLGKTSGKEAAMAHRVDLNSATREELMALPGIDGTAADKIIEGRPWKNGQSLVEKGILTKADFAKLRTRVTTRHLPSPSRKP
jgi:DNA uptake protein ComE-like DNA-binding protein